MSGVQTIGGSDNVPFFEHGFKIEKLLQRWAVPHGVGPPAREH
ncbi:MAG TPA: hypothetical protein VGS27_13785 [Candidatus Sulfotelmatobacter sp.]|nr:hypothetical protein [Candidatus Sulfotelmatobacter sp.]